MKETSLIQHAFRGANGCSSVEIITYYEQHWDGRYVVHHILIDLISSIYLNNEDYSLKYDGYRLTYFN